jgi:hypothetical protein
MRELELAGIPSIDATRPRRDGRAHFPLSRTAFVASIVVHVLAGYALSRQVWTDAALPPAPTPEFFLFEMPAPRAREAVPAAPPASPVPEVREEREPAPAPQPAQPAPEPTVVVEPPPAAEPAPQPDVAPAPAPRAYIDFDEERRRAANQVIGSRAEENEYLTFSIDDVAPPRPEPEPDRPSIFDGAGDADFGGRSVATVGQQRTKLGRKLAELCNALTGGFGVVFQGFGLFSGCASPDSEPSGLFPEVRPAYLDLMPECVDTRDTAPALALEAPFPTVKCRLVKQEEVPDELP